MTILSKRNLYCLALAITLTSSIIIVPDRAEGFFSAVNLIRFSIIGTFCYLMIATTISKESQYRLFKCVVSIGVPLAAIATLLITQLRPERAVQLVIEDQYFENKQTLFLFAATLIVFAIAISHLIRKSYLTFAAGLIISLVFFVIGMEEISWMQRILEVETNEYFLERNIQGETNFHNMSTHLTQNIFYLGGFFLMIFIPFNHERIANVLANSRLNFLAPWIPSSWFFIPFSVMSGIVWPTGYSHVTIAIGLVATALILLVSSVRYFELKKYFKLAQTQISLVIFLALSFAFTFENKISPLKSGADTEYMETFLCIGILAYAIDLIFRKFNVQQAQVQITSTKI